MRSAGAAAAWCGKSSVTKVAAARTKTRKRCFGDMSVGVALKRPSGSVHRLGRSCAAYNHATLLDHARRIALSASWEGRWPRRASRRGPRRSAGRLQARRPRRGFLPDSVWSAVAWGAGDPGGTPGEGAEPVVLHVVEGRGG